MKALLRSTSYQRLWLNSLFNALSFGGDFVLIGWSVLELTGTSAWVGTAFAIYFFPMVIFGILTGGLADRLDRHRLICALEVTAALGLGGFALLFSIRDPNLISLLALTVLLGTLRALHSPVRLSFAYDLAGATHVTRALAGISIAMRLGMLAGALTSGFVVNRLGLSWALVFMAIAHLLALSALLGRWEGVVAQQRDADPILRNLKAILKELLMNRVLLVLTSVTAVIEIFGPSIYSALPELAEDRLSMGAVGLGWMQAAQACGGLLIGLLILLLPSPDRKIFPYIASVLLMSGALVALSSVDGLVLTLILLGLVAAAISAWDIFTQSIMQLSVPDYLRGRAMGAWTFAIGTAPLGHLEMGLLATAAGVDMAITINGIAVAVVMALCMALTPALRRI